MASIFGAKTTEEPEYEVVNKYPDFEVRQYGPLIQAVVTMPGGMDQQMSPAFRALAGFIFGKNEARAPGGEQGSSKIAMTAPVSINTGPAKIAMTAPVSMTQAGTSDQSTTMTFTMPRKYKSIEELPMPKDPRVQLVNVPPRKLAVLQFSWSFNAARMVEMEQKLRAAADKEGVKLSTAHEDVQLLGYNPPWTLPWCRRNEVAIPVV